MKGALTLEIIQLVIAIFGMRSAVLVYRDSVADERANDGNGGMRISANAALERTLILACAQFMLLIGSALSIMLNDAQVMHPRAVAFRICVCIASAALWRMTARERINTRRLWAYIDRRDKRSTDRLDDGTGDRRESDRRRITH